MRAIQISLFLFILCFSSQSIAQTLFLIESGGVIKARSLESGNETTIFRSSDFNIACSIESLALDELNKRVYFIMDINQSVIDQIGVVSYSGANFSIVESDFRGRDLAFDYLNQDLYYIKSEQIDNMTHTTVMRLRSNTPDAVVKSCLRCTDLKIDSDDGRLYYREEASVSSTDLDGENKIELSFMAPTFGDFLRYTIDKINNKIYWVSGTEVFSKNVYQANINGSEQKVLYQFSIPTTTFFLISDPHLFVEGNSLYFFWDENNLLSGVITRNLGRINIVESYIEVLNAVTLDEWNDLPTGVMNQPAVDDPVIITITHNTSKGRKLTKSVNQSTIFKVCADGSIGSEFEIDIEGNLNPSDIILRIAEDPEGNNIDQYGVFTNLQTFTTSLRVAYQHPSYLGDISAPIKTITLEIYDISQDKELGSFPLHIYRAPVLMVHGLWGKSSVFNKMKAKLVGSNFYEREMVLSADYEKSSDRSFMYNHQEGVVKSHIEKLVNKVWDKNIAVEKVDIIGHSMGGLLSRLYIQGDEYQNNINKLITCNTPHFGSQIANLIFDPGFSCIGARACILLGYSGKSCSNGAISDLQVDNLEIFLLNQNNSSEVFIHSIVSTETIFNLINSNIEGLNKLYSFLLAIKLGLTNNNFVELFDNNLHDIIVAEPSQKGGLIDNYITTIAGQWHVGSVANPILIDSVSQLLNVNPSNGRFTKNGFNPPPPSFNYTPVNVCNDEPQAEIKINSPTDGETFFVGQTINLDVSGSGDLEKMIISIDHGRQDTVLLKEFNSKAGNFNYEISNDLLGERQIVVVGFDSEGRISCLEKSSIMIETSQKPIKINSDESVIAVAKGRTHRVFIEADFGTSKVYISELDGLEFIFSSGKAARVEKNIIRGQELGEDTLTIRYKGVESEPIRILIFQSSSGNTTSTSDFNLTPNEADLALQEIFPNPATDNFVIQLNSIKAQEAKIAVNDLSGKQVFSSSTNLTVGENLIQVNLRPDLPKGVYFVSLLSTSSIQTAKLIKQ